MRLLPIINIALLTWSYLIQGDELLAVLLLWLVNLIYALYVVIDQARKRFKESLKDGGIIL